MDTNTQLQRMQEGPACQPLQYTEEREQHSGGAIPAETVEAKEEVEEGEGEVVEEGTGKTGRMTQITKDGRTPEKQVTRYTP
eukprot:5569189-Karenia_brevis.AAC.1